MGRPLKNRVFVKTKAIVVIAIVLIFGLLVLNMLIVHWEHAKSHKVKTSVAKKDWRSPCGKNFSRMSPITIRHGENWGREAEALLIFQKLGSPGDKSLKIATVS